MIDYGKRNLLGVLVDAVDYEAAVLRIIEAAQDGRRYAVSATAVHGLMLGATDLEHRYRLNQLELVVPDGQPVRWGLNWLFGLDLPDRVYGPRLMKLLCDAANAENLKVYLYGSTPNVISRLAEALRSRHPGLAIVGAEPSKFRPLREAELSSLVNRVKESEADLLFVGLGCPRQEIFAYEYSDKFDIPVIAIGAAFDFHAGTLSQAPRVLQDHGLEWLYRLSMEPRRLLPRYLIWNPRYIFSIILQRFGWSMADPEDSIRPIERSLYG